MNEDTPDMDDGIDGVLDRAARGEATADEARLLAEWRRASADNEREYQRTSRLLAAAGALTLPSVAGIPTAASLLATRRANYRSWRTRFLRAAPWAAAAGLLVALAWPRAAVTTPGTWGLADVVTGEAEMTTLQLRDGSVVRLAPSSRLRFIDSDSAREVKLDGRAFFAIASAAGKPFVVRTDGGDARVLGTRFEVATNHRDVQLVVVEGRVALSAGRERVEVAGGEISGIRDAAVIPPQRVPNAESMESWVGKFLVFQGTPMREAARRIEAMYDVTIRVDSSIADRTVSAAFTDRSVDDVLVVICSATDARCERRRNEIVMSARK